MSLTNAQIVKNIKKTKAKVTPEDNRNEHQA